MDGLCTVLVYKLSFCFFKQKTAYEMRISDWSSDVCSSDLAHAAGHRAHASVLPGRRAAPVLAARRRGRTAAHLRGGPLRGRVAAPPGDRKSVVEGKSVSVRVDLGGRRIIKKKNHISQQTKSTYKLIICILTDTNHLP